MATFPTSTPPLWHLPGMMPLAVLTVLGFTGYAVLLPVAPLWVVSGGAGTGGAGLVNGVMLAATVATQGFIPTLLRRLGWAKVLVAGMVLLGAPGAATGISAALPWVLACAAVRGVGFGVLTVCGSLAVVELVEPWRRGAGIGAYGLAVAVPNIAGVSFAPWLAQSGGYAAVFAVSAAPVLAAPVALRLAARVTERERAAAPTHPVGAGPVDDAGLAGSLRALAAPTLILLSVTLAGGGVLTFMPQMIAHSALVTSALLVFTIVTALARWAIGNHADRLGAHRFSAPLLVAAVVGLALLAWAVASAARSAPGLSASGSPSGLTVAALLVGACVTGIAYGALQNVTLILAFEAVPRRRNGTASAVWNAGFDAGTATGSVLVGVLAARTGFPAAIGLLALLCALALPLALARRHDRTGPDR